MNCINNCCKLYISPYDGYTQQNYNYKTKQSKKKAGIFFYDPKQNKVLLVQSRGFKWGSPKGSMEDEDHNDVVTCALREVKEETGIDVQKSDINMNVRYIIDRTTYFYIECNEMPIFIQEGIDFNDANGITWIKVECLVAMVKADKMDINYHCKRLLKRFLKINTEL